MCRALKIDAAPVLALLPQQNPAPLQQVGGGLNAPFRERPGRNDPTPSLPQRPLVWAGLLLLVAAALIAFAPPSVWQWLTGDGDSAASAPASAAPVDGAAPPTSAANLSAPAAAGLAGATPSAGFAVSAASAALPTVETVHVAPAEARIAGAGPNTATISTNDVSWVEVFDGAGRTLLSRSVPPGEVVRLEGTLPLRLKIGNARATQLVFRGQPVDLAPSTRDNVARLELK